MRKTFPIVIAGALFLGACHQASAASPQVASLDSAPASDPSATGSAAVSGRPQLRLDTSDQEAQRLWTVYNDCLVGHGVKVLVDLGDKGRRIDQSGEPKSAYTACAGKLPQQPPELDADRNPNFAAQWNDNVKCLRAHGLMVHVTNPGEWTYDSADTVVPADEDAIEKDCLLEAFGAKK